MHPLTGIGVAVVVGAAAVWAAVAAGFRVSDVRMLDASAYYADLEPTLHAGDLNGDGRRDSVLVTPTRGYVVFGGHGRRLNRTHPERVGFAVRFPGDVAPYGTPYVDVVGDVNGDGRDDLAVTQEAASENGRPHSGSVYVVFGRPSHQVVDLREPQHGGGFRVDGGKAEEQFGYQRAPRPAGDVNGDGLADVLIPNSSGSLVIFGKRDTASIDTAALGNAGFEVQSNANGEETDIAGGGDFNGDGLGDLVVGLGRDPRGRPNAGMAAVIFGHRDMADVNLAAPLGNRGFLIKGGHRGDRGERFLVGDELSLRGDAGDLIGGEVAVVGDANRDGLADVAIGGAGVNGAGTDSGGIYVLYGR